MRNQFCPGSIDGSHEDHYSIVHDRYVCTYCLQERGFGEVDAQAHPPSRNPMVEPIASCHRVGVRHCQCKPQAHINALMPTGACCWCEGIRRSERGDDMACNDPNCTICGPRAEELNQLDALMPPVQVRKMVDRDQEFYGQVVEQAKVAVEQSVPEPPPIQHPWIELKTKDFTVGELDQRLAGLIYVLNGDENERRITFPPEEREKVEAALTLTPEEKEAKAKEREEMARKKTEAERQAELRAFADARNVGLKAQLIEAQVNEKNAKATVMSTQKMLESYHLAYLSASFTREGIENRIGKLDLGTAADELERMRNIKGVKSVKVTPAGTIIILTEMMSLPYNRQMYDIGEFKIKVETANRRVPEVSMVNMSKGLGDPRRYYHHPHVFYDDGRGVCWGNMKNLANQLLMKGEFVQFVELSIEFLQHMTVEGQYVDHLKAYWKPRPPAPKVRPTAEVKSEQKEGSEAQKAEAPKRKARARRPKAQAAIIGGLYDVQNDGEEEDGNDANAA